MRIRRWVVFRYTSVIISSSSSSSRVTVLHLCCDVRIRKGKWLMPSYRESSEADVGMGNGIGGE